MLCCTGTGVASLWWRLVGFGFRLLYNELAWLYDPVSWLTSLGLWRRWTRTALDYLPPPGAPGAARASRVLEVGFGPGHLLADMAAAGYDVVGLDPSRHMLRRALRRLRGRQLDGLLCRGRAGALPFAPNAFDALVLTFPTPFVYELAWLRQARRVLRREGCLVIVERSSFHQAGAGGRLLEWAYRVTGQRGESVDLVALLDGVGLPARRECVDVENSHVELVVAGKR
jgi:ubiquinone/menaquinone biosynthesis C-methylase UbiE